jgi:hypothetical protein
MKGFLRLFILGLLFSLFIFGVFLFGVYHSCQDFSVNSYFVCYDKEKMFIEPLKEKINIDYDIDDTNYILEDMFR